MESRSGPSEYAVGGESVENPSVKRHIWGKEAGVFTGKNLLRAQTVSDPHSGLCPHLHLNPLRA